jgi:hypothetical protein
VLNSFVAAMTETVGLARSAARRAASSTSVSFSSASALVALAWIWRTLTRGLVSGSIGYDEVYFVWTGWALNRGFVPYRDFIEYKPPMVFIMNALGLRFFGLEYHGYRWIFVLLTWFATSALFLALCRRGVDRVVAFLVATIILFAIASPPLHDSSLNDAETIGLSFYVLGLAGLLWKASTPGRSDAVGAAFMALSVLSKEPFVFAVVATWATFGFLAIERGDTWRGYLKSTFLGVATIVAPVLAYLLITRALHPYVVLMQQYLQYTKRIGCLRPQSVGELVEQAWPRLRDGLLISDIAFVGLPLAIAMLVLPGPKLMARVFAALAILGGFYAVTMGGCYFRHYFTMGMSGLFLWMTLGAVVLGRFLSSGSHRLRRWIHASLMALALFHFGPRIKAERAAVYPAIQWDTMSVPQAVLDYVEQHTLPDDYIFSDGSPGFYMITGRLPAAKEGYYVDEIIDSYPGNSDVEKFAFIRDQLVAHMPKIVYLSAENVSRKQRTRAALLTPFLQEFNYREVAPSIYLRP